MYSFERFDETKLPNKEDFYSMLNDRNISHKDYEYTLEIWNELEIKNMREYYDFYLKIDVLFSSYVFEESRNILALCHFFSSPGLS